MEFIVIKKLNVAHKPVLVKLYNLDYNGITQALGDQYKGHILSLKNKLNNYTKLSLEQRAKALKWMAKQNEELILIAFEKQKDNYFKLSKVDEDNRSILYLAALYMSVDEIYTLLRPKNKKNKVENIHEVKNVTSLQAKQFKKHKKTEKWDKMLNLKNKISKLRNEENLSYREIAGFLKTYHRLEVSHSYIATFFNKIKENNV